MVTGGGGSIGSELCRQIAKHSPKQLIIFDIYENNAYDIQQELLREQPKLDLVVLIGSVRDENRINSIFEQYRPEIIYHAAAHKHVPLMEGSPNEAIKNNILGTYNMVRMADKWNVKRFVQISVRNLPYTDTVTDAGFKMVVISDLHDHEFGKDNEKLIRCVKEQDPEMIILDGDMLNEDSKSDEVPVRLVKGLAEIASVYYALGNHELDYIGTAEGKKMQKHPENSELVKDLTDAGACVLEEGYRDVEIGGCKVRIGGMYEYAFALDGDNSAENLTGDVWDFLEEFQNTDRYKIMLCHRPDSFVFGDASDYWKIDLVISGHDHGGQVVIPFKGGLYGGDQGWFPPYVHGLYRTGRIRLFVTSGLSSEKQKLPRWNNRPEIAVLNVH